MDPLVKYVLFLLNVVGLDPMQTNFFAKFRRFFAFTTGILSIVTSLLHLVFNWHGIETFADINMVPSLVILIAKMSTLLVNIKDLRRFVDGFDEFWPSDKFGEAIGDNYNALQKKIFLVVSSLCSFLFVVGAILVIVPFFLAKKVVMFQGYYYFDIKTSPYFEIVHTCQGVIAMFVMAPAILGFDCLFICLIGKCYSGIELLKEALRKISEEEDEEKQTRKIAEFCEQHAFILNYISEMNEFYGGIMLVQSWASLGALIFILRMITSEGIPPPLSLLVPYGTLYIFLSMQLFYYCFGGNIISDQTLSITNEVYSVNWYKKTQPKLRKKLTFIIQRSQKAQRLTVGNMMNLNLECFVTVMRNTWSVYTIMRTIDQ